MSTKSQEFEKIDPEDPFQGDVPLPEDYPEGYMSRFLKFMCSRRDGPLLMELSRPRRKNPVPICGVSRWVVDDQNGGYDVVGWMHRSI